MPGPESSTCSTTTWPNGSGVTRTVTSPPAGVYCSALSTRLPDQLADQQRLAHQPCRPVVAGPGLRSRGRCACPSRAVRSRAPPRAPVATGAFSCLRNADSLSSTRAIASSWLTMCAARWLECAICCSERLSERGVPAVRCRSRVAPAPACMRKSGQRCLRAGAQRRRGSASALLIDWSSRASRSLIARTSGATSSGASRSSIGLRSSLRRCRMRCCNSLSGRMPRASASQTSNTATGRIANCGMMTPLMISVARRDRLPSVSATCTSDGAPSPRRAPRDRRCAPARDRSRRRESAARRAPRAHRAPAGRVSPATCSPRAPSTRR